jgi:hypothetical protein
MTYSQGIVFIYAMLVESDYQPTEVGRKMAEVFMWMRPWLSAPNVFADSN